MENNKVKLTKEEKQARKQQRQEDKAARKQERQENKAARKQQKQEEKQARKQQKAERRQERQEQREEIRFAKKEARREFKELRKLGLEARLVQEEKEYFAEEDSKALEMMKKEISKVEAHYEKHTQYYMENDSMDILNLNVVTDSLSIVTYYIGVLNTLRNEKKVFSQENSILIYRDALNFLYQQKAILENKIVEARSQLRPRSMKNFIKACC